MMKRRIKTTVFVLACIAALVCGCGKQEESVIDSVPEETGKEPAMVTVESEDVREEAPENDYIPEKFLIEQKDADDLLTEALSGTGCSAVFEETVEIDGKGYYTYSVSDPEGNDITDMLAVEGFSGEVFLLSDGRIKDFSEFSYYSSSSEKGKNINWDGEFVLDNLTVSLIPADEDSFEFTVTKKQEELISGVARTKGDEAFYRSSDEKEELEFKMTDDNTLQLVENGRLRISGQYIKE